MPEALKQRLQNGYSVDETDKVPENLTITNFDIFMYIVAIAGHFVDVGVDINIAVRYHLAGRMVAFGWTLAFILVPAFVNTAVSMRMYAQDSSQPNTLSNQFTRKRHLRVLLLTLQLAPILRFMDALIYAMKSRAAARKEDVSSQRLYYRLMLKEDSDAALLRVFECFLEAAPQHVLQLSLLMEMDRQFTVYQWLSISSSVIGMGWCLASYQRAVRFAQHQKLNMDWRGSLLQTCWHLLVSFSRVVSLATIAYMFPHWTILACAIHIAVMSLWLQLLERSPFCSQNKLAEIAFSITMGTVYLFTYILPVEGRTRYRYTVYYTICFLENLTCCLLWYFYSDDVIRSSGYFIPILVLCVVPFVLGMCCMVLYYAYLHPKVRKGISDFSVSVKVVDPISDMALQQL